jgi:hypothetical protein
METIAMSGSAENTPTPATGRIAEAMRGLWQITLYVVIVAAGLFAVVYGLVSQFDAEVGRALRTSIIVCGGGFFAVGVLGGIVVTMILATRHFSTATAAGMQKALETSATAQQRAIDALAQQVAASNAKTDAIVQTLANVYTTSMTQPRVPEIPPAPMPASRQIVEGELHATAVTPNGVRQMKVGPAMVTVGQVSVRETDLGDEIVCNVPGPGDTIYPVRYSRGLINHFVLTQWPQPSQQRWRRADVMYGNTARLLQVMNLLEPAGNSWEWSLDRAQVETWWTRAMAPKG